MLFDELGTAESWEEGRQKREGLDECYVEAEEQARHSKVRRVVEGLYIKRAACKLEGELMKKVAPFSKARSSRADRYLQNTMTELGYDCNSSIDDPWKIVLCI